VLVQRLSDVLEGRVSTTRRAILSIPKCFLLKKLTKKKIRCSFFLKANDIIHSQYICVCVRDTINNFCDRKNRVTYFRYIRFSFFIPFIILYRPPAIRVVFISSVKTSHRYCVNSFLRVKKLSRCSVTRAIIHIYIGRKKI